MRANQGLGGPVLGSEDLNLLSPLRDSKVGSLSRVVSGPGDLPVLCRNSLHPPASVPDLTGSLDPDLHHAHIGLTELWNPMPETELSTHLHVTSSWDSLSNTYFIGQPAGHKLG